MRISIGVPSLNYGRYLNFCLESLRTQSHSEFEVLIADGGSSDDSLEVVERFTAADHRFRLVSTDDDGQAGAVQKTFEASSGELFAFLNADDCFVRSDALALAASAFRAHRNVGVISFGGWYIDESGARRRPVRRRYHPRAGRERMRYRTAMLQPATFWRREVQQRFPLRTDLSYVFDDWFFFEAFQHYEWIFRSERVAGYRLHDGNKSLGVRPARIRELAQFESFKFGDGCVRERYLRAVARATELVGHLPLVGMALGRGIRVGVNAVSFATFYRLPGI